MGGQLASRSTRVLDAGCAVTRYLHAALTSSVRATCKYALRSVHDRSRVRPLLAPEEPRVERMKCMTMRVTTTSSPSRASPPTGRIRSVRPQNDFRPACASLKFLMGAAGFEPATSRV
jgi:hypothetical protein